MQMLLAVFDAFLEDQITDVMHNPAEMKSDMNTALVKINGSAGYRQFFAKAFSINNNMPLPAEQVKLIACWVENGAVLN
jgi:cytochrome c peroxidase